MTWAQFVEICKVESVPDDQEDHWFASIDIGGYDYEAGSFVSEHDAMLKLWDRLPEEAREEA